MKNAAGGIVLLAVVTSCHGGQRPAPGRIEDGLAITETSLKARSGGGWNLSVTVEPRKGFRPQRLLINAGPNPESIAILEDGPYTEPVTLTFEVECNLGPGTVTVSANGFDAQEMFSTAPEVLVPLEAPGNLLRLTTEGTITFLESTMDEHVHVMAWYEGCELPRDVTHEGTTFRPLASNIVEVDEDGRVTAVNVGETDIEIMNGDATAHVHAIVKGVWRGGHAEGEK